jgi:4,5-DOPA dioxygenase extradiol
MYPAADVPTLQLSVQPARGARHHLALGAALAELPARGILVVGSGHATHNLRDWMTAAHSGSTAPMPYVEAFAAWLDERLAAGDGDALVEYRERRPEAARAHPTEEHYVPLPVAWAAAGPHAVATRFVRETFGGALAMDAWRFDPQMGSGRI